ncbi:ATP-dependent RNA helicase DDX25 [Ahaetulla prasina]|uniref:ATP-dependent RNA helicase DDX25 n=1 Tax=Ahaetulla prasina TaxID=499056 RepID=UPI00264A4DDD|nr:ATP-dependent RNA helicase DDX25 [Ahaetulla prasina]
MEGKTWEKPIYLAMGLGGMPMGHPGHVENNLCRPSLPGRLQHPQPFSGTGCVVRRNNAIMEKQDEKDDDRVSVAEMSLLNKLIRTSLVESSHHVEILQRDPKSPLFSVNTFENLHLKPELLQGIYGMGFNRPSKIQESALPIMLADPPQNLIAQSQSGTGKTAAFVLAMLSRTDPKKEFPQCLCLSPTFELAVQTGHVVEKMGRFCVNINVNYAVRGNRVPRGTSIREQIIIGTPGTLLDWCFKLKLFNLKNIKVYVLDEADVMIDKQNFLDQSVRIQRALSPDCQLLLFSATFEEPVLKFAQRIIPEPNIIKLRREELTLSNIRQYYFECEKKEEKFRALCNIYGSITIGQAIIFCQTRYNAKWLYHALRDDGHQVSLLIGELTVDQRAEVIQQFRDGKFKVLITTNICARGIDVMQVTIVVNFTLPTTVFRGPDFEAYLHRIGRTGRFGKKGLAFNMVERKNLPLLFEIQDHFQIVIQRLDPEDMEALEKIED